MIGIPTSNNSAELKIIFSSSLQERAERLAAADRATLAASAESTRKHSELMAVQQAQAQSQASMIAASAVRSNPSIIYAAPPPIVIAPQPVYLEEAYCGPITWIVGLCLFPCICCCPCDKRTVRILISYYYFD